MQFLNKIFRNLLSFISSILGAAVGVIVNPLLHLSMNVGFFGLAAATASIVLIPVFALTLGWLLGGNAWIASAAYTLVAFAGLIGLVAAALPALLVLRTASILLTKPYSGLKIGWNKGLFGMFSHMYSEFFIGQRDNLDGLGGLGHSDFDVIVEQLGEAAVTAARRPMTEAEFNACSLSELEQALLLSSQSPFLSEDELARLKDIDDVAIPLNAYKGLQRLSVDNCAILSDRPERNNTVLLVKQYHVGEAWLPVSGVANIFDLPSLKRYFVGDAELRGNAVHPINRDLIKTPSKYSIDGVAYETRYIYHPYYIAGDEQSREGLSQEVIQLTELLRKRLAQKPTSARADDDVPEETSDRSAMGLR